MKLYFLCFFIFASPLFAKANFDSLANSPIRVIESQKTTEQKDIIDIFHHYFPKLHTKERDTLALQKGKKFFWVLPMVGYTLQTNFLAMFYGNMAFQNQSANMSTIISSIAYTQNKQVLFTSMPNIWTKNNNFNIVGDYRLMQYPQDTYGLGIRSSTANDIQMNYAYLRFYQYALKHFGNHFYAGLGYNLDDHWNIETTKNNEIVEKVSKYPYGISGRSVSSGFSLNLLYDNRANSINPQQGMYANVVLRANRQWLGSDDNYYSMLIDFRKYFKFSSNPRNILAIWSYNVFNFDGNPPFLDLPSTGWDTYSNMGRGYIQGRFRGKNLLYAEAEYRFGITKSGLLGGVVFMNAQTVPLNFTKINSVMPATGTGLRLKMNKLSHTNLSVDYAFGADGSSGFFFNVGEVF